MREIPPEFYTRYEPSRGSYRFQNTHLCLEGKKGHYWSKSVNGNFSVTFTGKTTDTTIQEKQRQLAIEEKKTRKHFIVYKR